MDKTPREEGVSVTLIVSSISEMMPQPSGSAKVVVPGRKHWACLAPGKELTTTRADLLPPSVGNVEEVVERPEDEEGP